MTDRMIVFSDLDGTLLDGRTYSFEQAFPALDLLRKKRIPLVLVSSKTRAELEIWRGRLENGHPFVSENGGGIFIPEGYFPFPLESERDQGYQRITLGMPYAALRRKFLAIRERSGIDARGFGDMTDRELAELTGLPLADAAPARSRDFGEPFVLPPGTETRFLREIEREGLRWTQGAFFHILGDHNKGRAVGILSAFYRRRDGDITTVGIGDSLNDLPLLHAVDRPVLVKKKDGTHDSRIDLPGLLRTEGIGPEGWSEAILSIVAE